MPAKILVVDDEPDTLTLLSITLGRAGYAVTLAGTGREALAAAGQEAPDLIILDIMLPDMTGLEVLESLRGLGRLVPPVIFFTAKSRSEDVSRGLESGAFRYLVKPTSREKLLETVRAALSGPPDLPPG